MSIFYFGVFLICVFTSQVMVSGQRVTCAPTIANVKSWSSLYGATNARTSSVVVKTGDTVLFDLEDLTINGGITIETGATLYFDWQKNITLSTNFISISGNLYIGTEQCPFENKITITLTNGPAISFGSWSVGKKVVAVGPGGTLELHGAKGLNDKVSWTKLSETATKGSTILQLVDNVASSTQTSRYWAAGDRIVLATTDFDPQQSEQLFIKKVIDANTIEITEPLTYDHYGKVTFGSDQRAEVGLLSRNIFIKGKIETDSSFGGHLIALRGHKAVHIEGVEFWNMGQNEIGRYPIHFHRAGRVANGTYARYNSIRDSNFRCVTIHATDNVLIQGNVAYLHNGHCMFLEDGVEMDNKFINNLVISTKPKSSGQKTGSDVQAGISSYWITNPSNDFVGNVAVGSWNTGFWLDTKAGARGDTFAAGESKSINPSITPMGRFDDNVAHSCVIGFQIEATNFDAGDNPPTQSAPNANYHPMINGKGVVTKVNNFSTYKMRDRGTWIRLTDIEMIGGTHADNMVGIELGTGGSHPPAPSVQKIVNVTFVGFSGNKGNQITNSVQVWDSNIGASFPRVAGGMMGWRAYDGTQGASGCRFLNYKDFSGDSKVHHAIGVRNPNNNQVSTRNYIESSTFVDVYRKLYISDKSGDGGKTTNLRDVDGSISSRRNSVVLPATPYYSTPKCSQQTLFGLACPHKYVQMWVMNMVNSNGGNAVTLIRNQHTGSNHNDYALKLSGFADYGKYRYQPIVSVGASYLVTFEKNPPSKLAFELINGDAGDTVSFAICYPRGTTISKVYRGYGNANGYGGLPTTSGATTLTSSSSRTATAVTNGQSYYWDSNRGLLFITVKQREISSNYANFCPTKGCDFIWVDATLGTGSNNCVNSAYSGDSIQETSGTWLNTAFSSASSVEQLEEIQEVATETSSMSYVYPSVLVVLANLFSFLIFVE